MKKLILLSAAVVSAFCPSVMAQQTKILTADKHNEYGLVYTLPLTALDIEVTARKTVAKAGPYFQYSRKYIGTDNVIQQDYESWEITSVNVKRYGVPDTESSYIMQLKPGAITSLCESEDGMLLAINKSVDAPSSVGRDSEINTGESEAIKPKEYLQYVNEDFIASQSSAKQAQMLAESLMEVRDAKVSLTRGTAETMPTDGKQLELMLSSLSHQEAALTAAFTGTTETSVVTRHFSVTPDKDGRTILFRMSDFAGFVGADDYSGDPVYLNIDITSNPELPKDSKGVEKKLPKDAVVYNVPGTAKVNISFLGTSLYDREMEFSQFGMKFGLDPSLFSTKKGRSYAIFDPATGGLVEIRETADE